MERNKLSILVLNQPGALLKVTTVLGGRGLEIRELTARPDEQPEYTRVVVDFLGEGEKLRLARGQLERAEVVKTVELLPAVGQ